MSGPAGEVAVGPRRAVVSLVIAAIVLRGVGYTLLTPLYEGWDEYQHLGYFGTNSLSFATAIMPSWVMNDVAGRPVPKALQEQAPGSHLQSFREYWREPTRGFDTAVPLYEVQHGLWYYFLHAPLAGLCDDIDLRGMVHLLRIVNVGWTALGIWFVSVVFRRAGVGRGVAEGALVLLSVHPLFLMTHARVCNDAMAFSLACAGLAALLRSRPTDLHVNGGVLMGAAGAVKATAWTLIPAAIALLGLGTNRRERMLWFISFFGIVAGAAVAVDVARQGRFAPTQEAWVLAERGEGLGAVLRATWEINWFDEFSRRWGRQLLWVGGWSFAPLPKILPRLHQWILVPSLLTLVVRLGRGDLRNRSFAAFCVLACLGVALGQALHMAQSKAALGFVATPAWYAVITLPWLLAGLVWSWGFDERLQRAATAAFFALLLTAEIVGVFFSWLPTFADSTDFSVVVDRCSKLAGGKPLFVLGCAGFSAGWATATTALVKALRRETA